MALCEVCEQPITGERITDTDEGIDFCASCAASLLGAERDELRRQLEGAVKENERLRGENDELRMKLDYAVAKIERYRDEMDRLTVSRRGR